MHRIAVICPFGLDKGLISEAYRISGGCVRALVPEHEAALAESLGAGFIHTLPDAWSVADDAVFATWLAERLRAWEDTVVLAPATIRLRNIMPMTAWYLGAGLTADCTVLSLEEGKLLQTRPAFGNNMLATIRTLSPVQMATVRPNLFRFEEHKADSVEIIKETPPAEAPYLQMRASELFTDGQPLSQAQIILAGGLGIGSAAGFEKLSKIAKKYNASVAASRAAVDAGFAPYRCQVGVTGVTVCPKLYVAIGISGAVQHLSGMSGSETVIAINADPKAPIFDYADYGIVGDWEAVIDRVLEELL